MNIDTMEIERDIRRFLVDSFLYGRAEDLREGDPLLGGIVDSTGTIELVAFLQERFGITVEDDDVVPENLDSLKNVVSYVGRKLVKKAQT